MRCPNCGNENPEDYVFCDECGARLQPLADTGQGDSAPSGMAATDAAGSTGMSGAAAADGGGDMAAWQPSDDSDMSAGAGEDSGVGWQPQASQDTDAAGSAAGGMSGTEGEGAISQPGWSYAGPMSASSSTGMDDNAQDMGDAVPATEDTVDADAGPDMGGAAMPGVVPMAGAYSDTEVSSASGAGAGTGGGGEWASAAMRYLEEAQRALDNLRQHLSGAPGSAAASGASQMPGMSGEAADRESAYESMAGGKSMETGRVSYDYDESSTETGIGMAGTTGPRGTYATGDMEPMGDAADAGSMSAPGASIAPDLSGMPGAESMGAPMIEPAAEAGSLGAGAMGADAGMSASTGIAEAPTESGEPVMARLVVIATGAEMPLPDQEEITVGREDPSSGIFPDVDLTPYGGEDGGVSRRHAKLLRIGDDFFVEDLQSTNYTKLDGQRLPAHVRERLEDGARIDFGRVATIFRRS